MEDGAGCTPALQAAGAQHPAVPGQSPAHRQEALRAEQEVSNAAKDYYAEGEVRSPRSHLHRCTFPTNTLILCLCVCVCVRVYVCVCLCVLVGNGNVCE